MTAFSQVAARTVCHRSVIDVRRARARYTRRTHHPDPTRRSSMAFDFFNRGRAERNKALGDRLPPGQYATEKWPVLHYGSVPTFDPARWDFKVSGLVEN